MRSKVCQVCLTEKPLSEFYAHPHMLDGYLGKCKVCKRKEVHDRRWADIQLSLSKEAEWRKLRKKHGKRCGKTGKGTGRNQA